MIRTKTALHQLITVLQAPCLVLSETTGQIRPHGGQGWYSRDRRALRRLEVEVAEGTSVAVGHHAAGATTATFHATIAGVSTDTRDPTIMVSRTRAVSAAGLSERVELTNHGGADVRLTVRVLAGSDLASVNDVRAGRALAPARPAAEDGCLRWAGDDAEVRLRATPAAEEATEEAMTWRVDLPAGDTWALELDATCEHRQGAVFTPTPVPRTPQWTVPSSLGDGELRAVVEANLADLDALLLADPDHPDDLYAAAGSPWYLTLFGRDALWTARLLLPLGTELAAGTLRTLARRQGTRHDPETEEAPGKILHEARPAPLDAGTVRLPPLYWGTIDATALWVCLLHDAWRQGMAEHEVTVLLPNLVAAMQWITGADADPDGDGLIEYAGSAGGGLANQGWKDSADAIRHLDGRQATPPLALCEVQGYAHAAALSAAALADAFGLPGADGWRSWAGRLRERFHTGFWIHDEQGRYPAIALDGSKNPVPGLASNIAHLLGTGILDAEQVDQVTARLIGTDLNSGYGLRTLTTGSAAYNPVSYHCGSVWPHDTAIAIVGLAAEGRDQLASTLARGLIRAAAHFDNRPPELFGVLSDAGPPVHYPSACRPQAWSAAGVIAAALHLAAAGP